MWDSIIKMKYRAEANIADAKEMLQLRLNDRVELPLTGINGELMYLTGISALSERAEQLNTLYDKLPVHRGAVDNIVLDAFSSATIEGARTTVESVRKSFENPKTKDDRMVVNTIIGSNYAYGRPITQKNIRKLWDKVVDSVCDNERCKGSLYRDDMVRIASATRTVHWPAAPEKIPAMMDQYFTFLDAPSNDLLINSFVAHFYFVYVHPFCDGNGRTARILNVSQLYHGGYRKMKTLPLSTAINKQLNGYYSSLSDSEIVLNGQEKKWLDLSPFVSYMLDVFEQCLVDATLASNTLTDRESKILQRMNKAGLHAKLTTKNAAKILKCSTDSARTVLNSLCKKGYLVVDMGAVPYIYRLEPQFVLE